MAEEKLIIESLSVIERKVLPNLKDNFENLDEISKKSETDNTTTLRALEFLKNKKLVDIQIKEKKIIDLGINGLIYIKKHLPERVLLNELSKKRSISLKDIKKSGLNPDEAKASIGVLKRKALISVSNGRIVLTAKAEELTKKMLEEKLLEKLPIFADELEAQDRLALQNLKSRKDIVLIEDKKQVSAKLTELGKKISVRDLDMNLIEQLTPKIIKSSGWKGKKFRRYDITSQVPRLYGGKKHFVNQAIDYAKKIWLEMGFKEMTGNLVQTGFWNFDALFTAQDHPARELHDTFFIKNLEGKLPDEQLVKKVKKVHEGSSEKGKSRGWQYTWNEKDSKKVLLRTHTTCLSAQTLSKLKMGELPAKFFSVGKCFRNDTIDWSHGFEFNQTEGIVVDENANFRHLLGYLKEFAKKMGYEKVRFRPHYFPYTEPSLEGDVWNEEKGEWMEVFAAGIFRPEVTEPLLGKPIPVLAWGPGFDRMMMLIYKISDMREIYKNNLTKLREIKFWLK